MQFTFVGSGDAFGSGGRFNTCFHVATEHTRFLIDCGASSLVAMKRLGIDRAAIDLVLLTHFHADHFGGIPFFLLDAQLVAKRTRPLTIAGPAGLRAWYERIFAATFPGERTLPFPLELREFEIGQGNLIGDMEVTPFHVRHDDRAGPCLALRISAEGRTICYSGDTEWTDTLIEAARGADLFVCECYVYDRPVRAHLALTTLRQHLPTIGAKRVILTHMSESMLNRRAEVEYEMADDGKVIEV
jgi:ribonuclease BN (tRNA processing enzyme)